MFTPKHFIGLAFIVPIIIVALILCTKLVKKENNKALVLKITSIILIIGEFIKIIYSIKENGYLPTYRMPLYICSFFLIPAPIAAFAKGRAGNLMKGFMFHFSLLCGVGALIVSGDIIGDNPSWLPLSDNFYPFYSFYYHSMLIFFGFFLVLSKQFKPSIKSAWQNMIVMASMLIAVMCVNFYLGSDFAHVTTSESNMLYPIVQAIGFVPYVILFISIVSSMSFIFLYGYRLVSMIYKKIKTT